MEVVSGTVAMETRELSSFLTIQNVQDSSKWSKECRSSGPKCTTCLNSCMNLSWDLLSCSHGVCSICAELLKSGEKNIFCVTCQIRSVSPSPSEGEPDNRSSARPLRTSNSRSSENRSIVKTQLDKLWHLDDAVYKPLVAHFDNLLVEIKQRASRNVKLIETRFDELKSALMDRKKELIKSVRRSEDANNAIVEKKKKAAQKERSILKAKCQKYKAELEGMQRDKEKRFAMKKFLTDVDDIQCNARRTSTKNSVTELNEIELATDLDMEKCLRDALDRVVRVRNVARFHESRVGTPNATPCSSVELDSNSENTVPEIRIVQPIIAPDSDPVNLDRTSRGLSNKSQRRAFSVSPRTSSSHSFTPLVSPRQIRSAADGSDGIDLHPVSFLPDISQPPRDVDERDTRRETNSQSQDAVAHFQPDPQSTSNAPISQLSIPASLSSQDVAIETDALPTCPKLPKVRVRARQSNRKSPRRLLPTIGEQTKNRRSTNKSMLFVKDQTMTDGKLERPSGVCCFGNERDGVLAADCGKAVIARVGLDGQVTGIVPVWNDDGESVKANGIFDVTVTGGGIVVVSDSHQKQVKEHHCVHLNSISY